MLLGETVNNNNACLWFHSCEQNEEKYILYNHFKCLMPRAYGKVIVHSFSQNDESQTNVWKALDEGTLLTQKDPHWHKEG